MAIAFVQGNSNNAGVVTSVSVTLGSPVTAGNTVVGAVKWDDNSGPTIVSVTDDKGNNYDFRATLGSGTQTDQIRIAAGGFPYLATFVLGNVPSGGPTIITVSWGANSAVNPRMLVDEFSGTIASTTPVDAHTGQPQTTPGTGTDAVTSGTAATVIDGDLIYCANFSDDGTSSTVGTGFTLAQSLFGVRSEWRVQTTHGSVAGTWTAANGAASFGTCFMAVKPLAAAALILMGAICL